MGTGVCHWPKLLSQSICGKHGSNKEVAKGTRCLSPVRDDSALMDNAGSSVSPLDIVYLVLIYHKRMQFRLWLLPNFPPSCSVFFR